MNKKNNYYDLLGIDKKATEVEIKKAFRKKAAELHPDVGGDPKKFMEVKKAYDTLKDPKKKKEYDKKNVYSSKHDNFYEKYSNNKSKNFDERRYNDFHSSFYEEEEEETRPSNFKKIFFITLFIVFLICLFIFLTSGSKVNDNNDNGSYGIVQNIKNKITHSDKDDILKLGMTYEEVIKIMGNPDTSHNDIWVYGNSRVYFGKNGTVVEWSNDGELKTK